MKREYRKPIVVFEDFTLSTNIAGDCEGIVDNPTKGSCAVESTGGIAVFSANMNVCVFTPTALGGEDDDKWDGFCYHVSTEYNNLFNS